jgi:hypothetical protein
MKTAKKTTKKNSKNTQKTAKNRNVKPPISKGAFSGT